MVVGVGIFVFIIAYAGAGVTLPHLKSFIELAVPLIRLFPMIIMMPLKRCVAMENNLITLLRNEAINNVLISGP